MKNSVSIVYENKLCCMCGACEGICPGKAITLTETTGGCLKPEIDPDKCTGCGLCLKICPGKNLCGKVVNVQEPFRGNGILAWVGKAADPDIFENSQSGGAATALLVELLEKKEIAAAIVTNMNCETMKTEPVIANSKEQLMQTQKSKYVPTPLLSIVREIGKINGPVAILGLPCHVHGLINFLSLEKELKNKVKYIFGLICDRTLTYAAIDFLSLKAGIDSTDLSGFIFRDKSYKGYPGDVKLTSRQGKTVFLDSSERMKIKDSFTPPRCRICFDKMNIFSDITFGDPHGIENIDRQRGESLVIARNETGVNLLKRATNDKRITGREIPFEQAIPKRRTDGKKEEFSNYLKAWKEFGHEVPEYTDKLAEEKKSRDFKKYIDNLTCSFSLENFPSRSSLINSVKKKMAKQEIIETLLIPLRIVKKIFKLFKKGAEL